MSQAQFSVRRLLAFISSFCLAAAVFASGMTAGRRLNSEVPFLIGSVAAYLIFGAGVGFLLIGSMTPIKREVRFSLKRLLLSIALLAVASFFASRLARNFHDIHPADGIGSLAAAVACCYGAGFVLMPRVKKIP
jgi:hypothetical protein